MFENSSLNVTIPSSPYSDVEKALIIGAMTLLSMCSVTGNLMVFYAYFREKKLQRATNYFILSLASADLIVGLLLLNVYTTYTVTGYWAWGHKMCLLWISLDYSVFQASVFGVLMIAVDRYLSIRFPHGYRYRRTDSNVRYAIVIKWIFAFVLWVPLILSYTYTDGEEDTHGRQCHIGSENDVHVTIVASGCAYIIPALAMVFLAIHSYFLLHRLRKKSRNVPRGSASTRASCSTLNKSTTDSIDRIDEQLLEGESEGTPSKVRTRSFNKFIADHSKEVVTILTDVATVCKLYYKKLDRYQRVATFNIILAMAFVATVFPYGVISVVRSACVRRCVSLGWWHFGYIASYVNSLLNPLCYAFGNKNFNTAFKKILLPKKRQDYSIPEIVVGKVDDDIHSRNL